MTSNSSSFIDDNSIWIKNYHSNLYLYRNFFFCLIVSISTLLAFGINRSNGLQMNYSYKKKKKKKKIKKKKINENKIYMKFFTLILKKKKKKKKKKLFIITRFIKQ